MALVALAAAAVGIVIVLLVMTVLLLRQSGGPDSEHVAAGASPGVTGSPSPSTPTTTAEPGGVETPLPTPQPGDQDVRALPAGLYCRDLLAQGYSYSASVDYWRLHAQPNEMDADRNGIPCETVYSASDVVAYWQPRQVPLITDLPSGLFCRDLAARGFDYAEAVAYWWSDGAPDQMDADLNGIPCETVYPAAEVEAFWSP